MTQARIKVVCIEDDRETAELIAEELTERGFETVVAYDGQEGLLAIVRTAPEIVLCDISLPTMSGFDVLQQLNEFSHRLGPMHFIFLTALADRDNELKGRRLGADDYITKPIDFERLVLIINARLAGVARSKLQPKAEKLNPREVEVLTLVARGNTSAQIAKKLRLSKRTVDFHMDNARVKLRAANRIEAVVSATHHGLIKP
jgi:DNA-binding NarL/FixJ family response regulator